MRIIDVRCPPEANHILKKSAGTNLKKNLIAHGISPAEVENMRITVCGFEGIKVIQIWVWEINLDEPLQRLLKETIYLSFGEETEVHLIDGPTRKVLSERKRFAHV